MSVAWPISVRSTSVNVTGIVAVSAEVSACSVRFCCAMLAITGASLVPVTVTTKSSALRRHRHRRSQPCRSASGLRPSPDNRTRSRPPRTTGRRSLPRSRRLCVTAPGVTSAINAASSSARPVVVPVATAPVMVAVWPTSDRSRSVKVTGIVVVSGAVSVCSARPCCAMSAISGASLLPVTVTTTSCEVTPPWWSSTFTV